jgi:hypothetical protein
LRIDYWRVIWLSENDRNGEQQNQHQGPAHKQSAVHTNSFLTAGDATMAEEQQFGSALFRGMQPPRNKTAAL